MILEGQLLNTCDKILNRLNKQGYKLEKTINYSPKKDGDDYYFIINKDEAIDIVISYGQSNGILDKDKIELSMFRPGVNVELFDSSVKKSFDNRGLEVNEDFLYNTILEFLQV